MAEKGEIVRSPLDELIALAPKTEEFTIPIGDESHQVLRFRRERNFAKIRKAKQIASEKAGEIYDVLEPGRDKGEAKDPIILEVLSQCCLMADFCLDGGVDAFKFYELSKEFGAMFGMISDFFSAKLSMGEAEDLSKKQTDSKN